MDTDIDEEAYASSSEFPAGYAIYYATFPCINEQKPSRHREKLLFQIILGCSFASPVSLAIAGTLVGKNLLESVLLVLERAAYKSGLPPSLPPYRNLGSDALFSCDICLYIPVDSTLFYSLVALEYKLSSSLALQIPTGYKTRLVPPLLYIFKPT
jgi:hypothetical protein